MQQLRAEGWQWDWHPCKAALVMLGMQIAEVGCELMGPGMRCRELMPIMCAPQHLTCCLPEPE